MAITKENIEERKMVLQNETGRHCIAKCTYRSITTV